MAYPALRFDEKSINAAYENWRCTCGPAAFAAVLGMTLDEARSHFPGYRGWVAPTMMWNALASARVECRVGKPVTVNGMPSYGLARVQWHGPWMAHNVPVAARYRHTHWVAAVGAFVFDINAGWVPAAVWRNEVVPEITDTIRRCHGRWSVTHVAEVEHLLRLTM